MIGTHHILSCDQPGCVQRYQGPPVDPAVPLASTFARTLAQAAQEGWRVQKPLSTRETRTRHFCPCHAEPEFRTIPDAEGSTTDVF